MRLNPGIELRDNAGQLELAITRHVDVPSQYETRYDDRLKIALAHAHAVTDDDLLRAGPEWITDRLVGRFAAAPVTWHIDDVRPERIPLRGQHGEEHVTPQILFRFSVSATGAIAAVSMNSQSGPEGALLLQDVVVTDTDLGPAMNAESLAQARNGFIERLTQAVESANAAIEGHRQHMHSQLLATLTPRFESVKALHEAAATLGIPIGPRSAPERIPLQSRSLSMTRDATATVAEQQWHLDWTMAEDVMTTIMSFSTALERLPNSAGKLLGEDEETIRDILLFVLNANYRNSVTGETFRGAGKTDLLLRWEGRDAFIAECKFWPGPTDFGKAIDQLLGYTVWRDTTIALILFLRNIADTSAIIRKAATVVTEHPRFVRRLDGSSDPLQRQDFAMHAVGDQERLVRLALLPVVITQPAQSSK